jgi:rubrerythrin
MSDPTSDQNLLEPLKIALKMEAEGKRLFAEAATKATGKQARQTFEFLIEEEDRHIQKIQQFFARIEEMGGAATADVSPDDTHLRLEEFEHRLAELRDDLKPTPSDIEAFRFAIKFENNAEGFYREQIEKTSQESVREFYRWLVREEELHAQVLASCLEFAEDPANWFRKRDGNS